jgi:hypothetical protein
MVKQPYTNSDFIVLSVKEPLYGRRSTISFIAGNIGLNYGLMKATLSGDSVNYQAIVPLRSKELKTIGWTNFLKRRLIILKCIIWSVMPPISIRMAVC